MTWCLRPTAGPPGVVDRLLCARYHRRRAQRRMGRPSTVEASRARAVSTPLRSTNLAPAAAGIAVNRATAGYRGEGKTDARDAAIIADQARMRRDLRPLRPADPLVLELRMLTTHRADL